jgi:hypothetical protein
MPRSKNFCLVLLAEISLTILRSRLGTGTKRLLDELRQFCRYVLSDDVMAAAAYTTLVVETIFGGLAAHYGNSHALQQGCTRSSDSY